MSKWLVYGTAYVGVQIEVEAEDKESAIEEASDQLDDLISYCGNGGMDKLVGVDLDEASLTTNGIVYDEAEYLGESEEEEDEEEEE